MSSPCHCCQPSANYTNVVDYNCIENNAQFDQSFDRFFYDPNAFNGDIGSNFASLKFQDWPVYNQPDFSQSYLPNNTELLFDNASTKNFLHPYYASFDVTPQVASSSFMPSPSSVASDFMLESLPLTPEYEAMGSPSPHVVPMNYPLNEYFLPIYDDSNVYAQVKIEPVEPVESVAENTDLLVPSVNMSKRKKITRRKTTNTQQLQCPVCIKVFSRPYNLKSHMRIHTNDRPFICQHEGCKWTFARPHDLKRHEMLHTGVKPFECSCGKKFARSDAYKRHWKVDAACIARRTELGLNMLL